MWQNLLMDDGQSVWLHHKIENKNPFCPNIINYTAVLLVNQSPRKKREMKARPAPNLAFPWSNISLLDHASAKKVEGASQCSRCWFFPWSCATDKPVLKMEKKTTKPDGS
jgi:hypothetical protein